MLYKVRAKIIEENLGRFYEKLTDGKGIMTFPDGKKVDSSFEAGKVGWESGVKHLPENTGDYPHELILVELKDKQGSSKEK